MRDFDYSPTPPFIPDPLAMTTALRRLAACARQSPDKSTQNAALVTTGAELMSPEPCLGLIRHNRPMVDDPRCDTDREVKLAFTVHAEEMAAFAPIPGPYSDMVALWAACPGCARAIVLAGFSRVWTLDLPCPDRWKRSVELGRELLTRLGVQVIVVTPKFSLGETWLHDGKVFTL